MCYTTNGWLINKGVLASGDERRPVRRGVFRRIEDRETGSMLVGLYINTNKTADTYKEGQDLGYVIGSTTGCSTGWRSCVTGRKSTIRSTKRPYGPSLNESIWKPRNRRGSLPACLPLLSCSATQQHSGMTRKNRCQEEPLLPFGTDCWLSLSHAAARSIHELRQTNEVRWRCAAQLHLSPAQFTSVLADLHGIRWDLPRLSSSPNWSQDIAAW